MFQLTKKDVLQLLMPELRAKYEQLKLSPEITHLTLDVSKDKAHISEQYMDTVQAICATMNFKYKKLSIINPTSNFSMAKKLILDVTNSDSVDGVLYNDPFRHDPFGNQLSNMINPGKDIECITPTNYGGYVLHSNNAIVPCMVRSLNTMSVLSGIAPDFLKILIISPLHGTHKGLIPRTNLGASTITFTHPMDTSIIDTSIYDYDIIISLLSNTNVSFNKDVFDQPLTPKLVLDYGWLAGMEYTPSLPLDMFGEETTYYNLQSGLMEVYVINALINLANAR